MYIFYQQTAFIFDDNDLTKKHIYIYRQKAPFLTVWFVAIIC